jgi:hypothetical protein
VDQLPEDGEASSDLSNPHVLYRKVIEYVGAADQLANLSQEVPYLHNQGCGSGSGLDPDSIGSVDPDPDQEGKNDLQK